MKKIAKNKKVLKNKNTIKKKKNLNNKKTIKKKSITKVTENMTFAEVMKKYPNSMEVFINNGMHCFGCSGAAYETIKEGSLAHGISPEKIISEINKIISKKK